MDAIPSIVGGTFQVDHTPDLQRTLLQILRSDPVDWDAFLRRLVGHPHEAGSYANNWYAKSRLQQALSVERPPVPASVVRALLGANPDAAHSVDGAGATALFYACSHDHARVVKVILDANPDAAGRATTCGKIPLHVVRHANVARMLLAANPRGIAVRDHKGAVPLHHAASYKGCEPEVTRILLESGQDEESLKMLAGGALARATCGGTPLDEVGRWIAKAATTCMDEKSPRPLRGCDELWAWEKLVILAEHAVKSRGSQHSDFHITHALVSLGCLPCLVWHAAYMNPNQCTERDASGRAPLAIAAALLGRRGHTAASDIIETLLNDPIIGNRGAAFVPDSDSSLPLHLAAEAGGEFGNGMKCILMANPAALEARDGRHGGMFPFMLAAASDSVIGDEADASCSLDTVYSLLRESPMVLGDFIPENRS